MGSALGLEIKFDERLMSTVRVLYFIENEMSRVIFIAVTRLLAG